MSSGRAACASADRGVYLVDYRSGVRRPGVRLSTDSMGPIRSLAFSPDGTSLALVAANGTPSVWRVEGDPRQSFEAPGSHYDAGPPSFSADGRVLAFAGSDGGLWRWDVEDSGSIPVRLADDATPEGRVVFASAKGDASRTHPRRA